MPDLTITAIRSFFTSFQRKEIHDSQLIHAAVLVPLFEKNGEMHILLTKRTEDVEHHKGQISFPGGVRDQADKTITDTALRETEEEIGVQRGAVEVIGAFNDFSTPSGFCITPIIGYMHNIPPLHINSAEVIKVFDVPLTFFLNAQNERMEQRTRSDGVINVYFYRFGDYKIWGVTAAMLRSFLFALVNLTEYKKLL